MTRRQLVIGALAVAFGVSMASPPAAVTLAWDAPPSSDHVTGYLVGYAEVPGTTTVCPTDGTGDTFVPVTPATALSHTVTTLTDGRTYCLRVYAVNANGRSAPSNTVGPFTASGTTPTDPLPTPGPQGAPALTLGSPPQPATTTRINFGPSTTAPAGYLADRGLLFGDRGNGRVYGWNVDATRATRDRDTANPNTARTTLIHLQRPSDGVSDGVWELVLPNGAYDVLVCAGDPGFTDSVYKVLVEDVLVIDAVPTAAQPIVEVSRTVTVADGGLTIRSGPGAVNTKLCFVTVTPR
jgi:hypothetical protein